MIRILILLWFSFVLIQNAQSQCDNLEVDAGQDFKVCPDEDIFLQGDISGNYTSFTWEPANRVLNPFDLFTTAVGPGTYRLVVSTPDDMNLITNGSFAGGNASFISDYIYVVPGPYPGYGYYTIGNNPSVMNGGWDDCSDVTGEDQMMIIDGSDVGGLDVWCQTVPVNPNTDYIFIFHATSTFSDPSPPVLSVKFNGAPAATYAVAGSSCNWEEFITDWNSGGLASVEICIENTNVTRGGNDFALDNIQFYGSCVEEDEVTVEVVEMPLDGDDVVELPCPGQLLDLLLTDYPMMGPPYEVEWTTFDGNIVSQMNEAPFTATVNAAGTYVVELRYNDGMTECIKSLEIEVEEGEVMLEAFPEEDIALACLQDGRLIAQDANANNLYEWYSDPGNITSRTDTTFITVSTEGTYYLIETDPNTGCRDTNEIEVFADNDFPDAVISGPDTINCLNVDDFYLDGSNSAIGQDDGIFWSTSDGSILNSNDSIAIRVGGVGVYQLVVIDTLTGCADTSQIEVFEDRIDPVVQFPDELELDCIASAIELFDGFSSHDSLSYEWSYDGGLTQSDTLLVTQEGRIIVRAIDDVRGCSVLDTIEVTLSSDVPAIVWPVPEVLDCNRDRISISGGLMAGDSLEFSWSSTNGSIVGATDGEMIEVNASGWYLLTVLNTNNGCSKTDSVQVVENYDLPLLSTTDTSTLSCGDDLVSLLGSTDFGYPGLTWYWETIGGNIVSDPNSDQIDADAPGEYFFIIENSNNGCSDTVSQVVIPDQDTPELTTELIGTIDCRNDRVTLTATGTSVNGSNVSYEWTTQDGVIMGDETLPTLTVMDAGTYQIEVIDEGNGCRNASTLTVVVDTISPVLTVGGMVSLDCAQQTTSLSPLEVENANWSYEWTTQDGVLPSNPNQHTITVNSAGTYVLTVLNPDNGCSSARSIEVQEDTSAPVAMIAEPGILTCENPSVILDASGSSVGGNIEYEWTELGGNFTDLSNEQMPEVDEAGIYRLVIWNIDNSCNDTMEVEVLSNESYPTINIGNIDSLGCENAQVNINAMIGNSMSNTVSWRTPDGNIISGTTGNSITVDVQGMYIIRVEDLSSGCVREDSVVVSGVATGPTGFMLDLNLGNCIGERSSVRLDGIEGGEAPYRAELNGLEIDLGEEQSLSPGNYVLAVYDRNNCVVTDTFVVNRPSEYPMNIGLDFTITAGDYELLIPQFGFDTSIISSLQWSPSEAVSCDTCIRTEFISTSSVGLILEVTTEDGCETSADIFITVIPSQDVFIPNSFSPNADKLNDYFTVFARSGRVKEVKALRVYNRWGDAVFIKESFVPNVEEEGWDGRQNGEDLNPEVFIFTAEVEFIDGSVKLFSGDISLVK